jgi:hypothetical protein
VAKRAPGRKSLPLARVAVIDVVARGAATSRGVAAGDRIAQAKEAYPELRCGTIHDGQDRACAGKIGKRRFIWFGGDPIEAIAVADVPLGDVG